MSDESVVVSEVAAGEAASADRTMDIGAIMALIPHRYPFLLIDRILELERRVRIVALKNVTMNEPQFQGHFPGYPIMPGVLMVEAMAQAGCVMLLEGDSRSGEQAGAVYGDRGCAVSAAGGAGGSVAD